MMPHKAAGLLPVCPMVWQLSWPHLLVRLWSLSYRAALGTSLSGFVLLSWLGSLGFDLLRIILPEGIFCLAPHPLFGEVAFPPAVPRECRGRRERQGTFPWYI
jgi:hypothetical protein